ncbi:MAG TPA: hypothetical protein VLQ67_13630 [Arachnia sp.]|nr:hypothetical protein [Arachnia sp.]
MSTVKRQANAGVGHTPDTGSTPTLGLVGIALAVSWLTMLGHNLYELPLAVRDVENTGPLLMNLVLLVAYWRAGSSRVVQWAILGWALLNLVIGGVLTVLPLAILPFVPEQSPGHYLAHLLYAVGQVPLTLVAVAALRHHDNVPQGGR